jgi:hypothetical protein
MNHEKLECYRQLVHVAEEVARRVPGGRGAWVTYWISKDGPWPQWFLISLRAMQEKVRPNAGGFSRLRGDPRLNV